MLALFMYSSSDNLLARLLVDIANDVDAVEGAKAVLGFLPLLAFTGMFFSIKLVSEPVWQILALLMHDSSVKLFVDVANAVDDCKADFGFLPLLAFTGMFFSMKLVSEPVWQILALLMHSSSVKLFVDIDGCRADFGFLPLLAFKGLVFSIT